MEINRLLSCLRQRVPVHDFLSTNPASNPSWFSLEAQEDIFQVLTKDLLIHNPYYTKLFLKKYIDLVESNGLDTLEELYELYCDQKILSSVELEPTDSDTLCYTISNDIDIYIKEYPKLISGKGTTGLRTWEAALFLAHYLNTNEEILRNFSNGVNPSGTSVLELGTGTGLVSLALAKNPKSRFNQIYFTDGDTQLIENLSDTFQLNSIDKGSQNIVCQQLLWGTTDKTNAEDFIQEVPAGIDYLIAADVTYDSRILSVLCSTILDFFRLGTKAALIAATVRNEETLRDWESELSDWFGGSNWWIRERCEKPEDLKTSTWYRKGTAEIRIYEIRHQ